jgi:LysR family glycine cleavage system transcriptional activator
MVSPRLLERSGPLQSPADLLKLPLIDPTDVWWLEWFAEAGVPSPDLSNRVEMRVENQQLAGRAALAGQGVAILMPAFFADELGSGLLVQPFPLVRTSPARYWLVYLESRRLSPKIRAFRDWLLGAIGEGNRAEAKP